MKRFLLYFSLSLLPRPDFHETFLYDRAAVRFMAR